jgi:N-glycosylase/DNA lyase
MNRALFQNRLELALRAALEGLQEMQPERARLSWHEESLWAELVACLLGSAVPFALAHTFASHLRKGGFLDMDSYRSNPTRFELRLTSELESPLPVPSGISIVYRRYRFPRLRARHICHTARRIQESGRGLHQLLESCVSENEMRRRLVEMCVGIGPKQASLFLRNAGWATELAILDVHVLRFMGIALCSDPVISPGSCLKAYEKIENRLRKYAAGFGAELAHLDVAIWVVMRVLRQEAVAWL